MERTISAMIGKGSVNHNTRAFTAKNVDKNRSADNVEFCQEDIKQVEHNVYQVCFISVSSFAFVSVIILFGSPAIQIIKPCKF